jgi:heat shock protein HslJ
MNMKSLLALNLVAWTLTACSTIGLTLIDPLDGTSWKLDTYSGTRPIEVATITAIFEDGEVRGKSGCNSYFGSYQIDGDNISMSQVGATLMACMDPEGIMDQEAMYLSMLIEAESYEISSRKLILQTSNGGVLTFSPLE